MKKTQFLQYETVWPTLVGIGTLPPPLSPASVPLPPEPGGGGAHSPAGEGLGESQFRRLEKKLSTLPTLWVQYTTQWLHVLERPALSLLSSYLGPFIPATFNFAPSFPVSYSFFSMYRRYEEPAYAMGLTIWKTATGTKQLFPLQKITGSLMLWHSNKIWAREQPGQLEILE